MTQTALDFRPRVNATVDPRDAPRLSAQCAEILAMLREHKRTNVELAAISLKYTSRLSEVRKYLRALGEELKGTRGEQGIWTYEIVKGE